MKRSLTGIIAATMVLGTAVPAAFADAANTTPNDISGNQYATAIQTLVNMGTPGDASNPEALNLYSDGSFRPDLGVSRGQFIAYVYNVLKEQQVITKDYNQDTQPYIDEDSYFRNQINDMYLYGFLNNLDLGNGAIGENYKTPAWWASQLLCNVAGISYDSSQPYDALNQARKAGWFANTPDEKTNPNYYLNRGEMAQVLLNFYVQQYPDAFKGVVASATVSAKNATTSAGTKDQLSVTAADINGNAVDLTQGSHTVTYAVQGSNAGDAAITSGGSFVAAAGGKFNVVATVDGVQTQPVTINVYGQPAGLTAAANKDLVADGASSATVTVNVNDSNGNLVGNYNGPVTLTSSNGTDASVGSSSTATLTQTVNAVNGVATFTVYSLPGATAGDAPTLTASVAGNITGTFAEKVDAPVASSFSVAYASGQPNGLAVNGYNPMTAIQVTALDQAGNKVTNYTGSATVSISGPATLLGGSATSMTAYFSNGQSNAIYLLGKQGVTGNVVVTVSATGLTSSTFTVPAYVQTAATSLVATATSNSVASGGSTTITIKELDANGNLAVVGSNGQQNQNTVTVSQDTGNTNVGLYDSTGNTAITSVQLSWGQATITVKNNGFIGAGNVKFADGLLNSSAPMSFTVGTASKIAPVTTAVYAPAGSTQTATFQLEDGAGNAIKVAGDTFALTATNNGQLSASSATTDANGQFTVKVTLPSTVGTGVQVNASATGFTGGTETLTTQSAASLATTVGGNVYDPVAATSGPLNGTNPLSNGLTSGQSVYLDVYGLDAVGIPANLGDSFTVTSSNSNILSVSQSPIAGVAQSTIPTSSADTQHVTVLKGLLGGTATITVTDTSVVGSPSYSYNVTVKPQTTPGSLVISGLSNNQNVVAGQTYALTISLADAGGNPVFLGQNDTNGLPVGLTDTTGVYGNFRNAGNGYSVTSVTIPQYGNQQVVYWTAPVLANGSKPQNVTLNFQASYNGKPVTGQITGINVQ